jgi:predicted NAD-dependent protein-ADP-ribosyltransferase YbiA (DUF1768 family)
MNGLDKSKKVIKRKPLTEKQAIQIMTKRRACIEKFRKTLKKAPIKAPRKKKEKKDAEEQVVPEEVEGEPEEKETPIEKKPKKRTKKAPEEREGEKEQPKKKVIKEKLVVEGPAVLYFYSGSKDEPYPGSGSGEQMPPDQKARYQELSKIPQWRKKLSNFWLAEFTLDGHKWASVEHYYQGSKFKKENPEFYLQFSLDSGSELSKDPIMAKGAGGKSGKIAGKLFRPTKIKVDKDFFSSRVNEEMYAAQEAKFKQNPDLTALLKATNDAVLKHHVLRSKPVIFEGLMQIRETL